MENVKQKLIKRKLKSSKIEKPGTKPRGPSSIYKSNFEYIVNNDIYFIHRFHDYA